MPFKQHMIILGAIIGLIFGVVTGIITADHTSGTIFLPFVILYLAAITLVSIVMGAIIARMLYAAIEMVIETLKASGIFVRKKRIRGKQ